MRSCQCGVGGLLVGRLRAALHGQEHGELEKGKGKGSGRAGGRRPDQDAFMSLGAGETRLEATG